MNTSLITFNHYKIFKEFFFTFSENIKVSPLQQSKKAEICSDNKNENKSRTGFKRGENIIRCYWHAGETDVVGVNHEG